MQADMLWGELWYQHAAADMGSGPQGCRGGWGLGEGATAGEGGGPGVLRKPSED